jgi:hypothetical protein
MKLLKTKGNGVLAFIKLARLIKTENIKIMLTGNLINNQRRRVTKS